MVAFQTGECGTNFSMPYARTTLLTLMSDCVYYLEDPEYQEGLVLQYLLMDQGDLVFQYLHTCQPSLFRWDSPTFTTLVPPSHFYPLLSHFHKSTSINHTVAKKDDSEKREYNFKSAMVHEISPSPQGATYV